MYQDYQNRFSVLQDETTVDDHISDNVINLVHAPLTVYENPFLVFRIGTAIVSAGGGTLEIKLVTSAAAGLGTPTVLWSSGVLANATIVAWTADSLIYLVRVPPVITLQYLGMIYTIGTAVFTAGTWDAFLTPDIPILIGAAA